MDRESDQALLEDALRGREPALTRLIERLTPIVHARAARCLLRYLGADARDRRSLVEDYAQDVFLFLFADRGAVFRKWEPGRGLSLDNFVGLIAERQSVSALRTGKRNPWREDTALDDEPDAAGPEAGPERTVASADALERLLDRMQGILSPQGWDIFQRLYVDELSVAEVVAGTGLKADAVYAWRSRLRRLAKQEMTALMSDPERPERMTP